MLKSDLYLVYIWNLKKFILFNNEGIKLIILIKFLEDKFIKLGK